MNPVAGTIVENVVSAETFRRLWEAVESADKPKRIGSKGLRASSLGAVVAALARKGAKRLPLIVAVASNHDHATEIYDDLQFFEVPEVHHYPKSEVLPYDDDEPLLEEQVKHLEFFNALLSLKEGAGAVPVCATSIEALFTRVAPLEMLRKLAVRVEWGQPLNTEEFADRCAELGFERVTTVESRGEFAIRGGIVDVFPLDAENPVRIDLFGEDIESMRWFDVHTQRSIRGGDNIEGITILPARERVLAERALAENPDAKLPTLLDLLPAGTLLVLHGAELYTVLDERFQQLAQRQYTEHGAEKPDLAPPAALFASLKDVEAAAGRFTQIHHTLVIETGENRGFAFQTASFETVKPSLEHYVTQIRQRLADENTVVIVCDNEGQAQRMDEMLRENEIGAVRPGGATTPKEMAHNVLITTGTLHNGFVFSEARLYVVTDREIFGRYKRRHVYRKIYKGTPVADPREIHQGDFVVHLDHGIGRFEGMRTQTVDGRVSDFLELHYADNDKLLVPVEKIAYVHKFSGTEQAAPPLDKLGGKKWVARRKKSQEDIEKLARQLLELYAKRDLAQGFNYHEDSLWQREFEASFLYTETPDQLRAIADVKMDMMAAKPMDRLVCGDVGYGKTEVAIRAAFKAIQDNKQVALLCPTTILAQQHFHTFRERFADYPIVVEMMSRFKTAGEIKEVGAKLKTGEINMVVGTHALLAKSIQFKDLGLVIVDEEQRFGVAQKERLKELRTSVDFLTLTATPIPRTLYMALSGLRDMSVINTPPADRHPIRTKIIHWDNEQIEEAILRELNRGGQVFFVHNRVQTIHQVAERIREIVPSARIAIGHGQMADNDLEQVMLDFIDGKHDILVSTTIIENGVDIPNVNTIIINRADAFGLAQLYQLRGRVGRETRRAYAYLIVPAGQAITEQAVARLAAIEEFTELGVGFNIAMRDMEIRGAGNLLGKEQHGSMNSVGFELYCKMLEETVSTLKNAMSLEEGEAAGAAEADVEIVWKVSAHIPAFFVPVEGQRVMLYKRVAEAKSGVELDEIAAEVRDRYGEVRRELPVAGGDGKKGTTVEVVEDLPESVETLFAVARMRLAGRKLGLKKIVGMQQGFKLVRENAVKELGPAASKVIGGGKGAAPKVYTDDADALEFSYADWGTRRKVHEAARVVQAMSELL
ncbi:MAG: transcription-repair coupling factor [Candidatus Sumerlaeaceae bacterium]|nr:transcription-repair coupling factor [Candidatus Sumerlaeaceae bacterium]